MAKADLHVHSRFSVHPSEWFLQRLGANECYVEPEFVYAQAKSRGMSFVTLTDHNCIDGALYLHGLYPQDTFISVETTTYFPEDECKIHILIYGLTEEDFAQIQELRSDIYRLRTYLKARELAHAVAHATFSENGKLTLAHLEKLILLFDTFESINGSRHSLHNQSWMSVISHLAPWQTDELYRKYKVEPFSATPWLKGMTGGSDDHSGLFVAQTYTETEADSPAAFLEQIKRKHTRPGGRHNDYKSFAFSLYKIAYDFSQTKSRQAKPGLWQAFHSLLFEQKPMDLRQKLQFTSWKWKKETKEDSLKQHFVHLLEALRQDSSLPPEQKLPLLYDRLAGLADEFFRKLLLSVEKDLQTGDMVQVCINLCAALPGIFLALPFISTLRHMYGNRDLLEQLRARFGQTVSPGPKRVLWFSDTLTDENGVASTLRMLGCQQHPKCEITIAACLAPEEERNLKLSLVNLPYIYAYTPSFYSEYTLRVPSVLKSLELICALDPDEIYISTPGPVGLLGLLAAKLLQIKRTGVYHTDFPLQAKALALDEGTTAVVEGYLRWFYDAMDEILVPTVTYMQKLEQRGYHRNRMRLFSRGLDTQLFAPRPAARADWLAANGLAAGIQLLYVGRLSPEKNLDFLITLYRQMSAKEPVLNLIIVGSGPAEAELKRKLPPSARVLYTGHVDREKLPEIYSAADVLVYPSTSDTFGMAVLEAQACGLPALISDQGGPQEIVANRRTGFIAKALDLWDWCDKLRHVIYIMRQQPNYYTRMQAAARENAVQRYAWPKALNEIFLLDRKKHQTDAWDLASATQKDMFMISRF